MRILMEDVPLMIGRPVQIQRGKPIEVKAVKVLLDKNTDRQIIDFKGLDRAMCSPGEVNRALQVNKYNLMFYLLVHVK